MSRFPGNRYHVSVRCLFFIFTVAGIKYSFLSFDYGEKFWMVKYKMFTCKCGSPKCKYSTESIHVTLANYNKKLAEAEKAAK